MLNNEERGVMHDTRPGDDSEIIHEAHKRRKQSEKNTGPFADLHLTLDQIDQDEAKKEAVAKRERAKKMAVETQRKKIELNTMPESSADWQHDKDSVLHPNNLPTEKEYIEGVVGKQRVDKVITEIEESHRARVGADLMKKVEKMEAPKPPSSIWDRLGDRIRNVFKKDDTLSYGTSAQRPFDETVGYDEGNKRPFMTEKETFMADDRREDEKANKPHGVNKFARFMGGKLDETVIGYGERRINKEYKKREAGGEFDETEPITNKKFQFPWEKRKEPAKQPEVIHPISPADISGLLNKREARLKQEGKEKYEREHTGELLDKIEKELLALKPTIESIEISRVLFFANRLKVKNSADENKELHIINLPGLNGDIMLERLKEKQTQLEAKKDSSGAKQIVEQTNALKKFEDLMLQREKLKANVM